MSYALDDLTDVDTSGVADSEILMYDDDSGLWVPAENPPPGPHDLDSHSDVTIDAPAENELLAWDGYSEWINKTAAEAGLADNAHGHAAPALDDLADVDAAAPDDGDVLAWDDDAGAWENVAAPLPGAHDLDSHSDVEVTDVANGELLLYADNGYTGWLNATLAEAGVAADDHVHALDDISDVDAAAPDDRDVLGWNDDDGEWQNLKDAPVHAEADGAIPQFANLVFGTGEPPDAATVPEGTVWIKYSA